MTTPPDIEAIEARWQHVTPGPWEPRFVRPNKVEGGRLYVDMDSPYNHCGIWRKWRAADGLVHHRLVASVDPVGDQYGQMEADGNALAHAPTDIAALITEVKRLRADAEKWRRFSEEMEGEG